ncbi:MAG: response regulator transcription factor [Nitrospiraceae bacterium]
MPEPHGKSFDSGSAMAATARSFPNEVFEGSSKEELLTVLFLMHRILDADQKRDVERIVTELPKLFKHTTGVQEISSDNRAACDLLGAAPVKNERTYHLFNYFFSCLSKAQTKIEAARPPRLRFIKNTCHLSPRELTVLLWMKEGKTNWEIARILGLSERTIRFHIGSIFEKLDVTSRTQAVARALGAGLITS